MWCGRGPRCRLSRHIPLVSILPVPSLVTALINYSLEAYKYLTAGWVSNLSINCVGAKEDRFVIRSKVRHSQSVSLSKLLPWVTVEKSGIVICGRCSCVAGL